MPQMNSRHRILAGLGLCVLTLAYTAYRYPFFARALAHAPVTAFMGMVVLWNGYAAARRVQPLRGDDAMVVHSGIRWGLTIAGAWTIVAIVPIHIFTPNDEVGAPLWSAGIMSALLLPFAAGASAAIQSGKVRIATRVGFWSGAVSGLIGFLVVIFVGFVRPLIPGLRSHPYVFADAVEHAGNTLELAIYIMFVFGSVFGVIAGTVGGWIGLRLYRTGEPPVRHRNLEQASSM